MSLDKKFNKIRSIFDNLFSIERDYFTVGGFKKIGVFLQKKATLLVI